MTFTLNINFKNMNNINFFAPFVIIYSLMLNNEIVAFFQYSPFNNILIYIFSCGLLTYLLLFACNETTDKIEKYLNFKTTIDLVQIIFFSMVYFVDIIIISVLYSLLIGFCVKLFKINSIYGFIISKILLNFNMSVNLSNLLIDYIKLITKNANYYTESEETNSEETNSEETNSEETNSEESNSEESNSEESNSEETNSKETNSEETKESDTESKSDTESDMSNKSTSFDIPEKILIFRDEEMSSKQHFDNIVKILSEPMITKTETIKILFEYIKHYEFYQLNEDGTYNKQSIKPDNGLKKLFNYNNESNDVITIKEFIVYVDKLFEKST